MIVGICGKAGSGKDTAADVFVMKSFGIFTKKSFAMVLKRRVATSFRLPIESTQTNVGKNSLTSYIKPDGSIYTVRDLLQVVGSFYRSIDPDYWIKQAFNEMHPDQDYVFSDVRYKNEAKAIKANGGVVIRTNVSPDVQLKRGVEAINNQHPSEIDLDDYDGFDFIVDGDLPITQYVEKVEEIYLDILFRRNVNVCKVDH